MFQVVQELHHWTSRKENVILTIIPLNLAEIIGICMLYIVYDYIYCHNNVNTLCGFSDF